MSSPAHPFWSVGFRPFFTLACLAGLSLPSVWVAVFRGAIAIPNHRITGVQWHAHEMFYGFGWAVLGGFLLTASKNWVGVRGYHGPVLVYLATAWLIERLVVAFGGPLPDALFWLGSQAFLVSIVGLLLTTLLRHRATDSYRGDNLFLLLILPMFGLAKVLLLLPDSFRLGAAMTLGLFRVAFLIMLERTVTTFMRNLFQVDILRNPALDTAIKGFGVVLVAAAWMSPALSAGLSLGLAVLLLVRLAFWHPIKAFGRLDVAVMYLGYLAIATQLLIEAARLVVDVAWVGAVSVHVFTFGAMGLVIPAMIIRLSNGHTGRKVVFGTYEKSVLWVMMLAFGLRVVGPQVAPGAYMRWLDVAATCWLVAFAMLLWRFLPFYLAPRIDGKEH